MVQFASIHLDGVAGGAVGRRQSIQPQQLSPGALQQQSPPRRLSIQQQLPTAVSAGLQQLIKKLSEKTLEEIAETTSINIPTYNRADLRAGIMHFGVGNFFRAHQAVFVDDLMNKGKDLDWAIVGANVIPQAEGHRTLMRAQDNLSMVVEQGGAFDSRARVLGCMQDYLGTDNLQAIIDRLADPQIRIVTLTITEGGYFLDAETGGFDSRHPVVMAEASNPDKPMTTFGMIVAGLKKRRQAGIQPFTVVSCDNILHNGVVTRNAVVGLGTLIDPELGRWIAETVAFPNGMVDRITPATGENERRRCVEEYGVEDCSPVFCERFRQWVLEDNFPAGRPALEEVGVMFVQDVTPYENMKLRILNGGHMVLALLGSLMGIQYVHEFMQNPTARAFWRKVMVEEVVPSIPPVPCVDLYDYLDLIEDRFANPKMEDTISRLLLNSSDKIPKFIHPSILDRLEGDEEVVGLALVSALWCLYCHQMATSDGGSRLNDPAAQLLTNHAKVAFESEQAKQWLAMEEIYSDPLMPNSTLFVGAFNVAFNELIQQQQNSSYYSDSGSPVEEVVERYLNGQLFRSEQQPQVLPRRCSIELVAAELARLLGEGAGSDVQPETVIEEFQQSQNNNYPLTA